MRLEERIFTEKQVRRILAEAAERESRDHEEAEYKISYTQLIQIAEEAGIDPKYLKTSTNQLVKEVGLQKAVFKRMLKQAGNFSLGMVNFFKGGLEGFFIAPTTIRKMDAPEPPESYMIPAYYASTWANGISLLYHGISFFTQDLKTASYQLSIHLGTNALSGAYEWYRHSKKQIEQGN